VSRSPVGRPALVAIAALGLTGAFLARHGQELGAIPVAARALGSAVHRHGIWGPSGWQSAAGALTATLVVMACYGLGETLWSRVRSAEPKASPAPASRLLGLSWACALGSGVWSLAWYALGIAHLYTTTSALVALGCGLALAASAIIRSRGAAPSWREEAPTRSALGGWLFALVSVPLLLAFLAALAPPTAKDALQYHLALPRAFLAGGGLVEVPGNLASYFALGAEMQGVWAMLLGRVVSVRAGEAAAGAIAFAFFPLLLATVLGWAREQNLPRDWAWLATAMVAGVPTIVDVAGSGYVDLALTLYVALATRAAARWWVTGDRDSLVAASLALGFALAVKLTAGFAVLFFALLVLARGRRALVAGGAGLVVAVVAGCPWYVRTWIRTGSPVFPFFGDVWPGHAPGWDAERSALLHGFNALYGGADKGLLDYLLTPLSVSLGGHREVAAAYEGVLGVSFAIALVLLLWALARGALAPELRVAAAGGGVFFACWLISAQVLRYLLPALPPLAVAAAGAGAAVAGRDAGGRALRWALVVCILAGELVTVAWFVIDDPLLAATGAEPRDAYLERRLDYYPYYLLINRSLPADVRIWLVDMRRDTYHLDRPYVGDYLFEDYTLRHWVRAAATGREVRNRALAAGITHVLIRHDILLDYARSPLVDDRRPRAENLARLARLRSFLTEETRLLRADRRYALIELAPRP
jgi:hypothetical protein